MTNLALIGATLADAERLADIRVAAMRPSLLALGRFDADRARDRLLDRFRPEDTRIVLWLGDVAGFFTLIRQPDHLYLDHLYLRPEQQGKGLGQMIVSLLKNTARQQDLPIRLMALRGSPSNGFYRRNGFSLIGESAFDFHYEWRPEGEE